MIKPTVHLPESLDLRLEAEATASGTSKASLQPMPVFHGGTARSAEEMDEAISERIKERSQRR